MPIFFDGSMPLDRETVLHRLDQMVVDLGTKELVRGAIKGLYDEVSPVTPRFIHQILLGLKDVEPLTLATIFHKIVHQGISQNGLFNQAFRQQIPQMLLESDKTTCVELFESILRQATYKEIIGLLKKNRELRENLENFIENSKEFYGVQYARWHLEKILDKCSGSPLESRRADVEIAILNHSDLLRVLSLLEKDQIAILHQAFSREINLMNIYENCAETSKKSGPHDFRPIHSSPVRPSSTPFSDKSKSQTPWMEPRLATPMEDAYGENLDYRLIIKRLEIRQSPGLDTKEVLDCIEQSKSRRFGDEVVVRDLEERLKKNFTKAQILKIFRLLAEPG